MKKYRFYCIDCSIEVIDNRRRCLPCRLKKLKRCERCNDGGKMFGHHKDYNMVYDVEWLCDRCHKDEHKRLGSYKSYKLIS